MYAVIKSGGKQYRVAPGQVLKLETLPGAVGDEIKFAEVLMVADSDNIVVGTPHVANATVSAEVISHGRHDKIRIIKFRRRKHHRKQMGHRQNYTEVKIIAITQ